MAVPTPVTHLGQVLPRPQCGKPNYLRSVLLCFKVVPANGSHLVLNEGNVDTTFLTEFAAYYISLDPGIVCWTQHAQRARLPHLGGLGQFGAKDCRRISMRRVPVHFLHWRLHSTGPCGVFSFKW